MLDRPVTPLVSEGREKRSWRKRTSLVILMSPGFEWQTMPQRIDWWLAEYTFAHRGKMHSIMHDFRACNLNFLRLVLGMWPKNLVIENSKTCVQFLNQTTINLEAFAQLTVPLFSLSVRQNLTTLEMELSISYQDVVDDFSWTWFLGLLCFLHLRLIHFPELNKASFYVLRTTKLRYFNKLALLQIFPFINILFLSTAFPLLSLFSQNNRE